MNKVFTITIALFKNTLRNTGEKKGHMSNLMGILISGLVFGFMFVFMAYQSGPLFHMMGFTAEFLAMVFFMSQIIVLIFGTILLINAMYFSKDAEFLLSLPVTSTTVFLAKLLYVYISELVLAGFMVLASGVTYGIVCGFGFFYYILLIPAILLIPMIPLVISALISVPLVYVISFFKNKGILALIILMALFGTLMYFYFRIFTNIGEDGQMILPFQQLSVMMSYLLPDIAMARLVTLTSADPFTDILMVVLFSGGLLAVASVISLFMFRRGVRMQLEQTKSAAGGKIEYTQNSALKTLIIKDIKEILGNPGLAFYCLFQIVIAPIIIVFYNSMFSGQQGDETMPSWMGFSMSTLMFFILVMSMNYSALTAVSREGKNFYVLKTMPLPLSLHLKAKLLLSDAVMMIGIIVSGITMAIIITGGLLETALFIVFATIFGLGFNRFLVFLDAKYPKLEWDNIVMALKNSKSAFISMGICMLVGILFFGLYIFVQLRPTDKLVFEIVFWAFFMLLAIGLNYLFTRLLYNNFERFMNEIE